MSRQPEEIDFTHVIFAFFGFIGQVVGALYSINYIFEKQYFYSFLCILIVIALELVGRYMFSSK